MKKLMLILCVMFLLSCEKPIPCWNCIIQQTKTKVIYQEYCDKTFEEIKTIEEKETFYHNLDGDWWHQTTICKLK